MPSRTLPDYVTGTVTVTNGSRTVTGSGTGWTTTINGVTESTIAAGDMLIVSTGRPVMIESVDSATQVTLVENWPNSTASGTAYKIRRYVALPTGSVLAALQSVEARGTDTNALTSFTVDGGTTRVKLRQAAGGQGALSVGTTGAADGSLVDAILLSSTALVGIRGVPSEELDVIRSQNATTTSRVYNSNTGASAVAELLAQTGTANSTLSLAAYDNAATPYAAIKAGSAISALFHQAAGYVWSNAAGSTEYMRVNSTGLGVGTASPSTSLVVAKNGSSGSLTVPLRLVNTGGGSSGSGVEFAGTYGAAAPDSAYTAGAVYGLTTSGASGGSGSLLFYTQSAGTNAEKMRIDSSGNIGISTVSPSAKLDVRSANIADGTGGGIVNVYSTTAQAADVGGKLDLGGLYDASNYISFASIAGRKENSTSGDWSGYLQFSTRRYGASFVERMRIDSLGKVGIGGSPTYKLDVQTSSNSAGEFVRLTNSGSGTAYAGYGLGVVTANSYVNFVLLNNNGSPQFQMQMGSAVNGSYFDTGTTSFRSTSGTNAFVIYNNKVEPGADNTSSLGSSGLRWSTVYAATGTINTSDSRMKTDVTDSDLGLGFVEALRPVSYKWIDGGQVEVDGPTETVEEPDFEEVEITETQIFVENGQAIQREVTRTEQRPVYDEIHVVNEDGEPVMLPAVIDEETGEEKEPARPLTHSVQRMRTVEKPTRAMESRPGSRTHYGLIAQEVKAALDAAGCADFAGWVLTDKDDPDSTQALRYDAFIAPLIKAVQELSARVQALENA